MALCNTNSFAIKRIKQQRTATTKYNLSKTKKFPLSDVQIAWWHVTAFGKKYKNTLLIHSSYPSPPLLFTPATLSVCMHGPLASSLSLSLRVLRLTLRGIFPNLWLLKSHL